MAYDDNHEHAHLYYAAIQRRMKENARKTRTAKWLSEVEDRSSLINFCYSSNNEFLQKMATSYGEWGQLTPGQEAAVRKSMAKVEERKAARIAERKAEGAVSKFVGTVTVRQNFDLTVKFHTTFDSEFGIVHIYGFVDQEGNVIVYKGSKSLGVVNGARMTGKATVKAHNIRDEVNQTMISRPALVEVDVKELENA